MTTAIETTEQWLYAGERVREEGKKLTTLHAWIDPEGRELFFKKVSGTMPGQAYEIAVTRDGDDRVTVNGHPRYLAEQTNRVATDRQLDTWRAEHNSARARIDAARVEKQAAADDELDRAIEVLRRHHERLRSHVKRAAFEIYVLGEMKRAPRAERNG